MLGELHVCRAFTDGQERLAVFCHANDDLRAAELGQVEHVRRLAQLKQHEVGDIDQVVAWDLADGQEPIGEPLRRRADPQTANDPPGVQGAELGRLVDDGHELIGRPRGGAGARPGGLERAA